MAGKLLKFKVVFTLHKLEIESSAQSSEVLLAIRLGGHETRSRRFKSRDKIFILQESLVIVTDLVAGADGKCMPKPGKIVFCYCDGSTVTKTAAIQIDLAKALRMPPKIECGRFNSKKMKGLLLYELSFKQISEENLSESDLKLLITNDKNSTAVQSKPQLIISKEQSDSKEKMGILDKDEEASSEKLERRSERSETPVFEGSQRTVQNFSNSHEQGTIKKTSVDPKFEHQSPESLQNELEKARESLANLQSYSNLQEKASKKSNHSLNELQLENHDLKTLLTRMEEELSNKGILIEKLKGELSSTLKAKKSLEKHLNQNESLHKQWNAKHNESFSSVKAKNHNLHLQLASHCKDIQSEIHEAFKVKGEIEDGDDEGLGMATLANHLSRAGNRLAEMQTWLRQSSPNEENPNNSRSLTEEMYKRKWQESENELLRMKTKMSSLVNAAYEYGCEEFLDFVRQEVE